MKWNKLIVRELTKEERKEYGDLYNFMWEGHAPDIGEEVLVTTPLSSGEFTDTSIDTWIEIGDGLGFENAENDVIYWMEIPKYNGEFDE